MTKKLISEGAEAKIFLENNKIIKQRISKEYRIKEIDEIIITSRTTREAKIIKKLESKINIPKLIKKEKDTIIIEYVDGEQLKKVIDNNQELAEQAGKIVAVMHENNIIHGDLTTSNFIYSNKKLFIIDFGLSFFSERTEDKAVDIHLFKQALESKHYKHYKELFEKFLKGYKNYKKFDEVYKRFLVVESRGRNKNKNQ